MNVSPAGLSPELVRSLREADLPLLALPRDIPPVPLKRISERHHGLARLVAAGVGPGEAALMMRYTRERVTMLMQDPAFRELVDFYKSKVDETFDRTLEQLSGLSQEVLQELTVRLEEEPEAFTVKELRELMTATLDRVGYGPSSKQEVSVTHNLGERLEAARQRALEARKRELKDITPRDVAAE